MKMFASIVALLILSSPIAVQGQDSCGEGFREFDFWVGSWTVRNPRHETPFSIQMAAIKTIY